jgi:hypothetical protein
MRHEAGRRWPLGRRARQIVFSAAVSAVVGLALTGSSVSGSTTNANGSTAVLAVGNPADTPGLDMGLGVQNSHNWLKLDGAAADWARTANGSMDQVAEYFDYLKADWVLVKFSACSGSYARLENWVAKAMAADKHTLISIFDLPHREGGDRVCDDSPPGTGSTVATSAIEEMAEQAQTIQSNLSPAELESTALEVGGESNWASDEHDAITRAQARLFYDIVNYTADQATGFPIVVFGGPLFKRFTSDWGTRYVSGRDYVEEALGARNFNDVWSHQFPDNIHFEAFGMHSGTCDGSTQRTMWTGCADGGGQQGLLDDMRNALSGRVGSAPIWNTSLIIGERGYPNNSPPNDGSPQRQTDDTKAIWEGIRDGYTSGNFPVELVMWNHLVDPYTDNFKCVGFMKVTAQQCISPDPNQDTYPSEYKSTSLFESAHGWAH